MFLKTLTTFQSALPHPTSSPTNNPPYSPLLHPQNMSSDKTAVQSNLPSVQHGVPDAPPTLPHPNAKVDTSQLENNNSSRPDDHPDHTISENIEATQIETLPQHPQKTTSTSQLNSGPDDSDGHADNEELTVSDIRAAVDEIDENIDEALGSAAQSIWRLATSVTTSVTSAVGDAPSLEQLRNNVTSHLKPLDAIGHNLSTKLESLAPTELPDVAAIAGSVKSVAQTVQRNAQQIELAILSKANGDSQLDPNPSETTGARSYGQPNGVAEKSNLTANNSAEGPTPQSNSSNGRRDGSVMLPGGLRVDEEIAKVGASLGKTVGGLWSGLWGAESDGDWERIDHDGSRQGWGGASKVPTTRFDKRILELQADPNTYCEPVADLDRFEVWGKNFSLDAVTDECIEILSSNESIAELYERVVPNIVEEDTFWMRYFFAKQVLKQEEERRKKLLERAEIGGAEADEDDGWGDDDWDDGEENGSKEMQKEDAGNGIKDADKAGNHEDRGDDGNEDRGRGDGDEETIEEKDGHNAKDADEDTVKDVGQEDGGEAEKEGTVETSVMAAGSEESGTERPKGKASNEKKSSSGEDDWGDDWE